jgi:hypothetical protein
MNNEGREKTKRGVKDHWVAEQEAEVDAAGRGETEMRCSTVRNLRVWLKTRMG